MIEVTPLYFVYVVFLALFTYYVTKGFRTSDRDLRNTCWLAAVVIGTVVILLWWVLP